MALYGEIVDPCFDGGSCHLMLRGIPPCRRECSIEATRRSGGWANVQRAALRGNAASAEIVARVAKHDRTG